MASIVMSEKQIMPQEEVSSQESSSSLKVAYDDKNDDDAMKYALELENFEIDPAKEKKLVRKIDFMIMPVIIALMSFSLLDKSANSYAAIYTPQSLRTDLHMDTREYSWVGSSFYLGFLVFQFPANYLLQHYPLSKVLSIAVILWGIILACHAACQSAASFLTVRVLLGCFEGFMDPAYILLTAQWWKKEEHFMRTCIWYGCQGFGTIFGAAMAYGLALHRAGYHKFATWRLLYIIIGILTIFFGFVSLVHVPDSPANAWFLDEEEKKYCLVRARSNQQGFGNHKFKKHQFLEALKDPAMYIIFLAAMTYSIPNGGVTNFGTILYHGDFGFDTLHSMLMNMTGGAIDVIIPVAAAYFNYKFMKNRRLPTMTIIYAYLIISLCLLIFTKPRGVRLYGYISIYCSTAVFAGLSSVLASNVTGYTKKTTMNAFFLISYCVGNIVGPQTFSESQAPGYIGAKIAFLVCYSAGTLLLIALFLLYAYRNKQKDKKRDELGDQYEVPKNIAFADLTDMENPEFRYSL